MNQRDANVRWLRDILEHLSANRDRLEWADDPDTVRLLTENMLRDLERCRRLCEGLLRRCRPRSVA